jgi:hypothetical protein
MFKRIFAFLALAFALFGTQCWATTQFCNNIDSETLSCTNTFSPGNTEGVYDFSSTGDGKLTVDFVTVLTTFTLTVTVNHTIDPLAPGVFPEGTVAVTYSTNGRSDEYDFTGNAGGPNGVPVRKVDYKGLITLTLSYLSVESATTTPAFLHAPGDNARAVYSEDILTGYSPFPTCGESCGSTMIGKTPGLSTVAAFKEPLAVNDCFVFVSPTPGQIFTAEREIEVEFRLFDSTCAGKPLRDKDARLSLYTLDSSGQPVFLPVGKDEGGKHFHFDDEEGVNEREVDTEGLAPGPYTITVFSDEFPSKTVSFVIQ